MAASELGDGVVEDSHANLEAASDMEPSGMEPSTDTDLEVDSDDRTWDLDSAIGSSRP